MSVQYRLVSPFEKKYSFVKAHLFDRHGEWHCSETDVGHGTICFLRCYPGYYGSQPLMKRKEGILFSNT